MIKAVIFDADGVMITSEYFSKQYERDFGVSAEEFQPYFNGVHNLCLIGKADAKEEMKQFLPKIKWKGTVDELFSYWHKVEHNINAELVAYIQQLKKKGVVCCLATNQEKYRTAYMMKEMGFGDLFDYVFSSSSVGYKKPQLEFYEHMAKVLKLRYDEMLFWDDTPEHLEGAEKLGIHAEFYSNFEEFEEKMNHYV